MYSSAREPVPAEQAKAGQRRGERLIVAGRAVLAASSLVAIWLDPSSPGQHAEIAYSLLAGYLVYALLLVPVAWRVPQSMRRLGLLTHAVDLCAFTLFMYFTEGATSPFFVYFVFSVLSGAVRWQWRGALWTGLAATTVFVGMGSYAGYVLKDPTFELNRFIIRGVYLVLVTTLLGYLTAYEQVLRRELGQIAGWPRALPETTEALIRQQLANASGMLGTSRVLMVWEDDDEPWTYLALLDGGEIVVEREPPSADSPVVAPELADASFYCADLHARLPHVILPTATGKRRWRGAPLRPSLKARFDAASVIALRFTGESLEGWLLAFDLGGRAQDLLALGEVLAYLVQSDLDRFNLQQRLLEAAAADERMRLARELHDGLLQSMTATGLQLETAIRQLERDPGATRKRLQDLQAQVAAEQADLRAFVQQLRELPPAPTAAIPDADARLDELVDRIAGQWGIRVELTRDNPGGRIGETLGGEVIRIVQECIANAARHGGATEVRVRIGGHDRRTCIEVVDNGRGFPFQGRYDLMALNAEDIGPLSVRQRVAALGGGLVVESGKNGARVAIALPI